MANQSSILAWTIPWTEEPGGLQFMRSQRVRHDGATSTRYKGMYGLPVWCSGKESTSQYRRRERRGFDPWVRKILWRRARQPAQYSCLENPTDREAWWVTVHGVTKRQTQLRRLSTYTHMVVI